MRPWKELFTELFCIACDRDALVASHMLIQNSVHWDLNFIRLVWLWGWLCIFLMFNAFYRVLLKFAFSYLWKGHWRSIVSMGASFITWTASLGSIISMNNLHQRHIVASYWSCMHCFEFRSILVIPIRMFQ